jgi:hypothetical protein
VEGERKGHDRWKERGRKGHDRWKERGRGMKGGRREEGTKGSEDVAHPHKHCTNNGKYGNHEYLNTYKHLLIRIITSILHVSYIHSTGRELCDLQISR